MPAPCLRSLRAALCQTVPSLKSFANSLTRPSRMSSPSWMSNPSWVTTGSWIPKGDWAPKMANGTFIADAKERFAAVRHAIRQGVAHACKYIRRHRITFIYLFRLALVVVLFITISSLLVGMVHALGFGAAGVIEGSVAASYQAAVLGGNIIKGSLFAIMQSIGALSALPPTVSACIVLVVVGIVGVIVYRRGA